MKSKTMLLAIPKNRKKGQYFIERLKPVKEDEQNYYFLQDEARIITMEWRIEKDAKKSRV